ncbi:type VI secretion system Vgr family domain protein, partial [Vibrio cholerae HC-71A1]
PQQGRATSRCCVPAISLTCKSILTLR